MRSRAAILPIVVRLWLICLSIAYPLAAQQKITVSVEETPVQQLLLDLSKQAGTPINSVVDDTPQPRLTLKSDYTTLEEALRDICKQVPNYTFQKEGGVYVFANKALLDDKESALNKNYESLEITIDRIQLEGKSCARLSFFVPPFSKANISFNRLVICPEPARWKDQRVVKITNKSILEAMLELSGISGKSWTCTRASTAFVKRMNEGMQQAQVSEKWDESRPVYVALWDSVFEDQTADDTKKWLIPSKQYWDRNALKLKAFARKTQSPLSIKLVSEKEYIEGKPIVLRCQLTNDSDKSLAIFNPFSTGRSAFLEIVRWMKIDGKYGEYWLKDPQALWSGETEKLHFKPKQTIEREFNLCNRTIAFNPLSSDRGFQGFDGQPQEPIASGDYNLFITVYFENEQHEGFCLNGGPCRFSVKAPH